MALINLQKVQLKKEMDHKILEQFMNDKDKNDY